MFSASVNRVISGIRASAQRPGGQGGFTWRVLLLAGGAALGQGVTIVAAPFLTRLYSPTDFGLLAVYVSILSAVIGLAALRYNLAIPVAHDDRDVANLLVLCLSLVVGMAAILGIVLWLVGDELVAWLQSAALDQFLWLLPLSFLGAGTYQVLNSWAIRTNQFRLLASTRLGQGIGLVGTQLTLGLLRLSPVGLLVGDAVGRACGSLSLLRAAWRAHPAIRQTVTLGEMGRLMSRYRRFPLISGPSTFVVNVRGQVPTWLLASFYGGHVVGLFGLGQRMLTVAFYVVASSVGDVYLNESSRLARERPAGLIALFWQTIRRSTVIVLPLLSVMALVAPMVFGPLFGPEWVEAGYYVRILAVASYFEFLVRSVGNTLNVLERQDLHLANAVLGITLTTGALVAGGTMHVSPLTTLTMYAVADSVGHIINLFLVWYAIRQTLKNDQDASPQPVAER